MTTGQEIADEVRTQLNDDDSNNRRWSDSELLTYINAGQREIVTLLPEANIVWDTDITASSQRMTLPPGGIKLIRVWNDDPNSTGDPPGPALTEIGFDAINSAFPEWSYAGHQDSHVNYPDMGDEHSDAQFDHYSHDPRNAKVYYLFPPPSGSEKVALEYSKIPTALGSLAANFGLGDEYLNAEVNYVTYRALAKDGRHGVGPDRRRELWNIFLRSLGLKIEAEERVDPPPKDVHNG